MREKLVIFILLGVMVCLVPLYVLGQEVSATVEELKSELQEEGISEEDVAAIEEPAKEMLEAGATKEDIKGTVGDLLGEGVEGEDLKRSMDSMSELVKDGATEIPTEWPAAPDEEPAAPSDWRIPRPPPAQ